MNPINIVIPRDHPCADGHFPDNPIVPGALLLSEVIRAWESVIAAPLEKLTVKVAKFLSPARPGDTIAVKFERLNDNHVRFQCTVSGATVLSGNFDFSLATVER